MIQSGAQEPSASELRLNPQKSELTVTFSNGAVGALSAEFLRVMSPSAEVQGHSPSERKLVPGKRAVTIRGIEPVGNYAVRLIFDDGHDTGLYTWRYLRELGATFDDKWARYLKRLDGIGYVRKPVPSA